MATKTFAELIENARDDDSYQAQWAILDFTEELTRRMDQLDISRAALAAKIGASAPYITKVLRGEGNPTIRSLAKLAKAVESVLRLHLAPIGSITVVKDEIPGQANGSTPSGAVVVSFPGNASRFRVVRPDMAASGGAR